MSATIDPDCSSTTLSAAKAPLYTELQPITLLEPNTSCGPVPDKLTVAPLVIAAPPVSIKLAESAVA